MKMDVFARGLATIAHDGQFRRDGVTPYIVHPEAVAAKFKDETKRAVAFLHDVIEDTDITAGDLHQAGFSKQIVDAVVALTKVEGETYAEFILRAKQNDIAREVKIADIFANLNDAPSDYQIRKYSKALLVLVDKT
jgi:(p)ppGpp synthase/HD superfamily hydrolase